MRRFLVGVGAAAIVAMVMSATAGATPGDTICTGTLTGVSVGSVTVPAGGACTLVNSTVEHNVTAESGAYVELDGTAVGGSVRGLSAQTVFINSGTSVGENVNASSTAQVFVFNATVTRNITSIGAMQRAEICGTTVANGNIVVTGGESEVLVGDPLADCAANTVSQGSIRVAFNKTSKDLVVMGNTVSVGNLEVANNTGSSTKTVEHNNGGNVLSCTGNSPVFSGGSNGTWASINGQCS